MLENAQTFMNAKANAKASKGLRAINSNPNIPNQLKNVITTQALLKPTPINGNHARG